MISYAWIISRSFGMKFSNLGGHRSSPVIPCGCDFPNHNIYKSSSMYYTEYLGYYDKTNYKTHRKYDIWFIPEKYNTYTSYIAELDDAYFDKNIINEFDETYSFVYMFLDYNVNRNEQLFVNYGKYHSSANRLALYGFIDENQPYEYVNLYIDFNFNDENWVIKNKYFNTFWNKNWLLLNGYLSNISINFTYVHI